MGELRVLLSKDGKTHRARYCCGTLKAKINTAEIVGQGLKACEELLEAEDKMLEEDLKR